MSGTFAYTDGTAVLNTIFAEEADHIDKDIRGYLLHTSPWIDLSPRGEFLSGNGYRQNSLIYDRALPQHQADGETGAFDTLGAKFVNMTPASPGLAAGDKSTGVNPNTHVDARGPTYAQARIDFTKKLREYELARAVFFGPFLDLENLRFVTQLQEQVSQMTDIMGQATQWIMEERFRTEYDKVCDNVVACKSSGTTISTGNTGTATGGSANSGVLDMDANSAALLPTANISNRVLDLIALRLRRLGAKQNAWGMVENKSIHAIVLSSEAIQRLTTESGYRDDVRYNNARVDELLKPLGVDRPWRDFFFLADDLAMRFTLTGDITDGSPAAYLTRVQPYTFSSSVLIPNSSYESAQYEAAHVLHKDACKHLIPNANIAAGNGVQFDPQDYTGKYHWLNIKDQVTNPFGTNGRFGGIIATATKPLKVDFGFVVLYDRTSAVYAE